MTPNVQARRLARDLLGVAESAYRRAHTANTDRICALRGGASPEELRAWKRDFPYTDEREARVVAITAHLEEHLAEYLDPAPGHQVWCVAYDSDTPNMDGSHNAVRMHEVRSLDAVQQALQLVEERSQRAPKRNLRIETRWVTDWQTEETR